MRNKLILNAFILMCLMVLSCANPKNLVYQDVKNFRLLTLSLQPDLGMDIQFYNPNTFGVTIKEANIDVFINDRSVGKTSMSQSFSVPAADTFLMPVKLKADLSGIFANAYSIFTNREVSVRLQGSVKSGKGLFVNIPINYTGRTRLDVADFK